MGVAHGRRVGGAMTTLDYVALGVLILARQAIRARATRKASSEGVLGRLPCSDRAGGDLVDCSQQSAGAGGPGLCYATLHGGRRLGR